MAKRAVEEGLNVISAPMTRNPTSGLGGGGGGGGGLCVSNCYWLWKGRIILRGGGVEFDLGNGAQTSLGCGAVGEDREAAYAGG